MASLEQIQQELKTLSPDALNLVHQFVQLLKKAIALAEQQENTLSQASD